MYSDLNLFFVLGISFYVLLFFLASRKPRTGSRLSERPGERAKTIRLSIAALLIAISLFVFQPYWFPSEKPQDFGFDRMLILGTGGIALVALLVSLRREQRNRF